MEACLPPANWLHKWARAGCVTWLWPLELDSSAQPTSLVQFEPHQSQQCEGVKLILIQNRHSRTHTRTQTYALSRAHIQAHNTPASPPPAPRCTAMESSSYSSKISTHTHRHTHRFVHTQAHNTPASPPPAPRCTAMESSSYSSKISTHTHRHTHRVVQTYKHTTHLHHHLPLHAAPQWSQAHRRTAHRGQIHGPCQRSHAPVRTHT